MKKLGYVPVGLGKENFSSEWLRDNTLDNISSKNKFYGEYTFHYWFWKNLLPKVEDNKWIGFCAYREFWGNKKNITKESKVDDIVIKEIPDEWNNFDTIVGEHIYMDNLKFSKLKSTAAIISIAPNKLTTRVISVKERLIPAWRSLL